MDKFNEIFVKRLKEVFENHKEEYNPDNWMKLQAKMGVKRNNLIFLMPYFAKAAIVIIFLGLSIFVVNKFDIFNNGTAFKNVEFKTEKIDISDISGVKPKIKAITDNNISNKKTNLTTSKQKIRNIETNTKNTRYDSDNKIALKSEIAKIYSENYLNDSTSLALLNKNKKFENIKDEINRFSEEIKYMDSVSNKRTDKQLLAFEEKDEEKKTKSVDKRIGFGVTIASVSNFSESSENNGINLGAGISASYKLSKNISFSTGMLLAKQSLNGFVPSKGSDNLYAAADNDIKVAGFKSLKSVSNINTNNNKLSFVAVDIPLNVVFKKKRFSISTGVSSLLCINETHDYEYEVTVTNKVYNYKTARLENYSNSSTVNKKEDIISNHFDFAQLLNFSVGYSIDLKKGGFVIEPYVKVPIGAISSQEIFMGSGGLSLRYDFFR